MCLDLGLITYDNIVMTFHGAYKANIEKVLSLLVHFLKMVMTYLVKAASVSLWI